MASRCLHSSVGSRTLAARLTRDGAELRAAVALVARGHARRVTVTGLRFGERLAPRVAMEGRAVGVDVRVAHDPSDRGTIVVSATPARAGAVTRVPGPLRRSPTSSRGVLDP